MQVNAHPIAALPGAMPPASQPAGCSLAQGEDSPFAKLLSAQPQRQSKEAPAPAHETAQSDADSETHTPRPVKPVASKGAAPREPTQRVDAAASPAIDDAADAANPACTNDNPDQAKPADAGTTTMDPALAQWIASLNRPVVPTAPPVGASGGVDANGVVPGGAAPPALARPGSDAAETRSLKGAEHRSLGLELQDAASPATPDPTLIAALDERHAGTHSTEHAGGSASLDGVAALAASAAAHAATRAEPQAAQPVTLPIPVTAPEFKAALGMQVSLLARDGVQHAELHLNPAEMGPISVQIALDGVQAQVDFGADSAHTRRIIEAGLPELASALRDAGLTLSGGGVSQHARGQSQGDGAASQRGDGTADAAPAPARRVNLRLPQGAVDLYA